MEKLYTYEQLNLYRQNNKMLFQHITKDCSLPITDKDWLDFFKILFTYYDIEQAKNDSKIHRYVKSIQRIGKEHFLYEPSSNNNLIKDNAVLWYCFFIGLQFDVKRIMFILRSIDYTPYSISFMESDYIQLLLNCKISPAYMAYMYTTLFEIPFESFKIKQCSSNNIINYLEVFYRYVDHYYVRQELMKRKGSLNIVNVKQLRFINTWCRPYLLLLQNKLSYHKDLEAVKIYIRLAAITRQNDTTYVNYLINLVINNKINEQLARDICLMCKFNKHQKIIIQPYIDKFKALKLLQQL